MYLKCDGPFGDKAIISKDAIESLEVFEMGDGDRPEEGSQQIWDVVIHTFIATHKYGSYFSEEEAMEVAESLARLLDGHQHEDLEPVVTIDGVQQKLGMWLRAPIERTE